MRLKESEIKSIIQGLSEVEVLGNQYELYLFGSRTDDTKLGGDIDLLLVVPKSIKEKVLAEHHRLKSNAKKYIFDQRVDITVKSKDELKSDPFFIQIEKSLIRLR